MAHSKGVLQRLIALGSLLLFTPTILGQELTEHINEQKAHELVIRVIGYFNVPPPLEISIERVSFKKLSDYLRNYIWPRKLGCLGFDCHFVGGPPPGPPGNLIPRGATDIVAFANKKLKIQVIDWDQETLVHEALHYVIFWMTKPANMIYNHHAILPNLQLQLESSEPFYEWLRENR